MLQGEHSPPLNLPLYLKSRRVEIKFNTLSFGNLVKDRPQKLCGTQGCRAPYLWIY